MLSKLVAFLNLDKYNLRWESQFYFNFLFLLSVVFNYCFHLKLEKFHHHGTQNLQKIRWHFKYWNHLLVNLDNQSQVRLSIQNHIQNLFLDQLVIPFLRYDSNWEWVVIWCSNLENHYKWNILTKISIVFWKVVDEVVSPMITLLSLMVLYVPTINTIFEIIHEAWINCMW